jgi:molybdenum cofactor cytidylyltransferase
VSESDKIGVVILAAGSSSRLGKPKQLLKFNDKILLQKMIDQSEIPEFTSKVIVLGANSEIIKKALNPGSFTLGMNENWTEGIASSIRKGVEFSLELNPDTEHLLFLLSDQPFVTAELLKQLLDKHLSEKGNITASFYDDDVGVPAIFSKVMFPLLLKLNGDQGAKKIMKRFPEQVTPVHFEMGHFDVDTPEDHAELLKLESKSVNKRNAD